MRRIILTLNAIISVLVTVIAIITGFYEIRGWKLLLVAAMGCVIINTILLKAERLALRRMRDEREREAKDKSGAVPGIPWFKMRFRSAESKDRDTRGNAEKVQKRAGSNPAEPIAFNRKGDGYRQG